MNNRELIEFVLYHEKEIKRAIYERREDGCLPKTGGGSSGHCRVSDPTAQGAIRNVLAVPAVVIEYGAATYGRRNSVTLRHPERWVKMIHYTRDYFAGTASGTLLKMRYYDCLTREEIMGKIKLRKSQYHAMVADIIRFAEGAATGLGLIGTRR